MIQLFLQSTFELANVHQLFTTSSRRKRQHSTTRKGFRRTFLRRESGSSAGASSLTSDSPSKDSPFSTFFPGSAVTCSASSLAARFLSLCRLSSLCSSCRQCDRPLSCPSTCQPGLLPTESPGHILPAAPASRCPVKVDRGPLEWALPTPVG